jgi:hypothetical protein
MGVSVFHTFVRLILGLVKSREHLRIHPDFANAFTLNAPAHFQLKKPLKTLANRDFYGLNTHDRYPAQRRVSSNFP